MKSIIIIWISIGFLYGCHSKADHILYAPITDTAGNYLKNIVKDTSVHIGTIMEAIERMTTKMNEVSVNADPDTVFTQLIIIHRQAVLEMFSVVTSQGNHLNVVNLGQNIVNRSKKIISDLQKNTVRNKSVKATTNLKFKIPITQKTIEDMAHSGTTVDNQFIDMLILIDKSEMRLARTYLVNGHNERLLIIAKNSILLNQTEILGLPSQKPD